MKVNMTAKQEITIHKVIEFIHNSMDNNFIISEPAFYTYNYGFKVINDKEEEIIFLIDDENITITTTGKGRINIKYELDPREELALENLKLDIEEYKKAKALSVFNNFFYIKPNTPTDINNLDDDD